MSEAADPNYRVLYLAQAGLCFYCFKELPPRIHQAKIPKVQKAVSGWTRDHFHPRKNGHDLKDNVVLSCPKCNSSKGARTPTDAEIARFTLLMDRVAQVIEDSAPWWKRPPRPRAPGELTNTDLHLRKLIEADLDAEFRGEIDVAEIDA